MYTRESDITICGHGSGTPSLKNMAEYLEKRYTQKMSNGVRKQLIRVRRVKGLTDPERQVFKDTYRSILGRNQYSQKRREYVLTPYQGIYYSDCSSSGDACWAMAGHNLGWMNTVEQKNSRHLEDVPVIIENGHIKNPEILKVGDALLFAGNESRPEDDYCGHVEYVYDIGTDPGWHWVQDGTGWYYQDKNGLNKHGWAKIEQTDKQGSHWYWFNAKGRAVTGVQVIDGKRYYFQPDGPLECALCITDGDGALQVWYV